MRILAESHPLICDIIEIKVNKCELSRSQIKSSEPVETVAADRHPLCVAR